MNETIEQNALYEQTYGAWYRRGMEDGIKDGIKQGIEKGIEKGIEQGIEKGIEQGIERGIERGIEQGIEEGIASSKKEIVINMYNDKMPVENISKYVDLKIDEIMKIISEGK